MVNRIKIMRKKRGLTMAQLATKAETTQQQIDRLEKGRRKLSVEWLEVLSGALDCEVVDLLPLDSDRKALSTARAKVIGYVDSEHNNALESYPEKDTYMLLFGRCKHVQNPKLFGLLVQGNGLKKKGFPDGAELIFNEEEPKEELPAGKTVVAMTPERQYYVRQMPVASEEVVKAVLVKTIRDE